MLVLTVGEGLRIVRVYDPRMALGQHGIALIGQTLHTACPPLAHVLGTPGDHGVGHLFTLATVSVGLWAVIPSRACERALFLTLTEDMMVFTRANPMSKNRASIIQVSSVGRIEYVARFFPELLNIDASEFTAQPLMKFVLNEDVSHLCRKLSELKRYGVVSFAIRMLRQASADQEASTVHVDIVGRMCNGAIFLVLMEPAHVHYCDDHDNIHEAFSESVAHASDMGLFGATIQCFRHTLESLVATKSHLVELLFFFQALSDVFFEVNGALARCAGSIVSRTLSLVHSQYLYAISGPVAC